jgi:hypothetical protein
LKVVDTERARKAAEEPKHWMAGRREREGTNSYRFRLKADIGNIEYEAQVSVRRELALKKAKPMFLYPHHPIGEELQFIREAFESNYIARLGLDVGGFERDFPEREGCEYAVAGAGGIAPMHSA